MRFRSWLIAELSRTAQGTSSTPKVHIECRISDALGHSGGRPYEGDTPGTKSTPASSLCDSGDFLLILQPVSIHPPTLGPTMHCGKVNRPVDWVWRPLHIGSGDDALGHEQDHDQNQQIQLLFF